MSKNRNTGAAPRAAVPDSAPDAAAVAAQASVEVPPVSSFDAPVQPSNGSPGAIMLQLPLDAVRPGTYAERRLSDLSAPEARIAARLLAGYLRDEAKLPGGRPVRTFRDVISHLLASIDRSGQSKTD